MFILCAAIALIGASAPLQSHFVQSNDITNDEAEDPTHQEWKRAYFATYPRSGNTWTCRLVEEASGVQTLVVYPSCDQPELPWKAYIGRRAYQTNWNEQKIYVRLPHQHEIAFVKTHFPALTKFKNDTLPSVFTLRIVRHPVDSFYSYYVFSNKQRKQPSLDIVPRLDVRQQICDWRRFQEYWNKEPNVITIRYEDLYEDPETHLKMILECLGYEVTQEDIIRAVSKFPPEGGILKHVGHFTKEDLALIKIELRDLLDYFGYEITGIRSLSPR